MVPNLPDITGLFGAVSSQGLRQVSTVAEGALGAIGAGSGSVTQILTLVVALRLLSFISIFAPILQVIPLTVSFIYSLVLISYRTITGLLLTVTSGAVRVLSGFLPVAPSWKYALSVALAAVIIAPTWIQERAGASVALVREAAAYIPIGSSVQQKKAPLEQF
jgi:hypothetical protein